jgi:plasmid stabilization system protein ParE
MGKAILWSEKARRDIRGIEQQTALQILHTVARLLATGVGDIKQLTDVHPPMLRLRAQQHRVLLRDHGTYYEVVRVHDRKDAYRG